jgi:hypothetical protein
VGPELPFNPRWSWVAGLGQSKHFGRQKDSVLELWIPLLSGAVGAILGAITGTIGTLITTRRRVDLEQRVAYDKGLQELRLPHYKRLYHLTGSFPRRWRPGEEPSRADLRQIGNAFHGWYFGEEPGGIFLTVKGRDVYFTLMNAIMSAGDSTQGAEPISGSEAREILELASKLRHQLVEDLGTAEPPAVRWTQVGPTPAPPQSTLEQHSSQS